MFTRKQQKFFDLGFGKDVLSMTPENPFSSLEDTIKDLKRQIPRWDNVFANYLSDRGLVTRTYKEVLNSTTRKFHI